MFTRAPSNLVPLAFARVHPITCLAKMGYWVSEGLVVHISSRKHSNLPKCVCHSKYDIVANRDGLYRVGCLELVVKSWACEKL